MVVDIQGVIATVDGDYHILTDPAVHAQGAMKEYGMGDLANLGMKGFNCAHVCGELCEKLGYISLQHLVSEDLILKTTARDDPLCYLCFYELNSKTKSTYAPWGHSLHKECLDQMKKISV